MATYEELMNSAEQIRTNELPESNTHELVGKHLKNQVEHFNNENQGVKGQITALNKNTGISGYPVWKPNTAYAKGVVILNPDGQLVKNTVEQLDSGGTYNPVLWETTSLDKENREKVAALDNNVSVLDRFILDEYNLEYLELYRGQATAQKISCNLEVGDVIRVSLNNSTETTYAIKVSNSTTKEEEYIVNEPSMYHPNYVLLYACRFNVDTISIANNSNITDLQIEKVEYSDNSALGRIAKLEKNVETHYKLLEIHDELLIGDGGHEEIYRGQATAQSISYNLEVGDVIRVSLNNSTETTYAIKVSNSSKEEFILKEPDIYSPNFVLLYVCRFNVDTISIANNSNITDLQIEKIVYGDNSVLSRLTTLEKQSYIEQEIGDYTIGVINEDGSDSYTTNKWQRSDYVYVNIGDIIFVNGYGLPGGTYLSLAIYDLDKVFIKGYNALEIASQTIIDTKGYIRVSCQIETNTSFIIYKSIKDVVENIEQKLGSSSKIKIKKNIVYVGMSMWWYDGKKQIDPVSEITTQSVRGYQTLIEEQFSFLSSNGTEYSYSGNSLGATADDDSSSIALKNWTKYIENAIWTLDTITNDFKRNIPIGTIEDYNNNTGATTYYGALRIFKDKINELSPNAIVVCANAVRRDNSGYTSVSENTVGHTLVDYEKSLIKIAAMNDWYFVDQYRLSGINDDTIHLTTIDGLHLNEFGYRLVVIPWIDIFNRIAKIVE